MYINNFYVANLKMGGNLKNIFFYRFEKNKFGKYVTFFFRNIINNLNAYLFFFF